MKSQIMLKIEDSLLEMPPRDLHERCPGAWEGVWLGAKDPLS